ncbi:sugar ABC transporter substrate-binding protein [Streptomyces chartreusis]
MPLAAATLLLVGCDLIDGGNGNSASPTKGDDITVGLLLPETSTVRFEKFDYPLIEKRVSALTHGEGKVQHANAKSSVATQKEQFEEMISAKVDVILVAAVDPKAIAPEVSKAKDAGIPVIAYDRLTEGPIDGFIAHDNELVGELQGRAIVDALGDRAGSSKVVMMNGWSADPSTARLQQGALSELRDRVIIAKSYYNKKWLPAVAKANMQEAISSIGLRNIAAVYAANDALAGGVIDAFKEASIRKIPPVTGQDADLPAVQRIVADEQHMTVYKSFLLEATSAADMAVAKAQGRAVAFDSLALSSVDSHTQKAIPTRLVPVVALSKDNIKSTVIKDGVYTVDDICTAQYSADCAAIDLQ